MKLSQVIWSGTRCESLWGEFLEFLEFEKAWS